ncbi:hypothetical protein [Formosa sp. 4Alg 33]|uniref:hypothetical protein n=1 Tax=Formosa sp. 4Alg 33 TaxID=3382189 RepID=UPI003D9C4254
MKITKKDLKRIESKLNENNTTVNGMEKIPTMSIFEYVESKEQLIKFLNESNYDLFYNIKIGNVSMYKTKDELEKIHRLSMSFLKALP